MAIHAPITSASARASSLNEFDTIRLDEVSGDLSIIRSLVDQAVDRVSEDESHCANLLFAALAIIERCDGRFQSAHKDLLAIKSGARKGVDHAAWSRALATFLAAQAMHAEAGRLTDADPDNDELSEAAEVACDAEVDAMSTLMDVPAPDGRALLFKLEKIIASEESTGSTPSWSWPYVQQTVADMRRLLGGER